MTSNYVILSIKSFLEVENDKYIIMCNFGGRLNNSNWGLSVCHYKSGRNVVGSIANTKSDFINLKKLHQMTEKGCKV